MWAFCIHSNLEDNYDKLAEKKHSQPSKLYNQIQWREIILEVN